MPIIGAKIYNDGSHFIAMPPENFTSGKHKKQPPKAITQDTKKQAFETAYKESMLLPKRERKKYIAEKLQSEFETAEQAKAYTAQNLERKKTNAAKRYTRLWHKVRLQQWNYFITVTYFYGHFLLFGLFLMAATTKSHNLLFLSDKNHII